MASRSRSVRSRGIARLRRALLVQSALSLAQPASPALPGRQLGRQLIAAISAELLVLFGVELVRFGQNLARNLFVVARGLRRGVRRDLRPIDRNDADAEQARRGAEREDLAEQAGQRRLMALAERAIVA